jgi:glycosyltransferase involved in cell wall biosynthesis
VLPGFEEAGLAKVAWLVPGFQSYPKDRCIPALTDLAHRVAQEYDLTVFALQYPGRDDFYQIGRVKIRSFANARIPRLRRLAPIVRAVRAIQSGGFDFVHAFWAAEPALVGALSRKKPFIVSCMGGEPARLPEISYGAGLHRLDRFYLKTALKSATTLTCGSNYQANLLKLRFPTAKIQPKICPLGIDTARFSFSQKDLEPPYQLLTVGSLLPVKGQANLIKAIAIVRQTVPQVRLKIVGEGAERPVLEQLIKEFELENIVSLGGAVPAQNMPEVYAQAHLFVLASFYESQCVALGEALACGLPVVAPPVGYAPELIGDGQSGLLAGDNSPSALAQAILQILAKKANWAKMKSAARAMAESYNLENCTKKFLALYNLTKF